MNGYGAWARPSERDLDGAIGALVVDTLHDIGWVVVQPRDAIQIDRLLGRRRRRDVAEVFVRLAIALVQLPILHGPRERVQVSHWGSIVYSQGKDVDG